MRLGTSSGNRRFLEALKNPEEVQRTKLKELLRSSMETRFGQFLGLNEKLSYEEFADKMPVTEYCDWQELVEEQRTTGESILSAECNRFQPTSGSTSKVKWIPYSKKLMSEFDEVLNPWIYDLGTQHPGFLKGKHYWSLSWLPTDMRAKMSTSSDLELFPWWKNLLLSQTMAVPRQVSMADTSEASTIATLVFLASCRDLSFISVWSPTFALNILSGIVDRKNEIAKILRFGSWGDWKEELHDLVCPKDFKTAQFLLNWNGEDEILFFKRLWPKLVLVSTWDTAGSAKFARELGCRLPQAAIQGKGLWSTEAAVTFPFMGKHPVALTSHFYEFKDLATEEVLPIWKLKLGQIVQPIITTGSGFWRYSLRDRLEVTEFLNDCPSFRFLGRLDGCDLVGEKISPELAEGVLKNLSQSNLNLLSVIAVPGEKSEQKKPFYLVLGKFPEIPMDYHELSRRAEEMFCELFHYRLARELHQLDACQVLLVENPQKTYFEMMAAEVGILGNCKVEPVALLKGELPSFQWIEQKYSVRAKAKNLTERRNNYDHEL